MTQRSKTSTLLCLLETGLAKALDDPTLSARIFIRSNPRARHASLRLDPIKGCIVLVRPPRISDKAVMTFIGSQRRWISKHLESLPARIPFADGAVIPFRGQDYVIRFRPEARGGIQPIVGAGLREIIVTGRPEHMPRRLRDWLKAEARRTLTPQVHALVSGLDVKVTRVSVRDTRSRWGSCSRDGKLSFSWRLIMAPAAVLTYVAAHEVAHLAHMNHGPAFWRTVARLLDGLPSDFREPESDWVSAREWLRRCGATLHGYG